MLTRVKGLRGERVPQAFFLYEGSELGSDQLLGTKSTCSGFPGFWPTSAKALGRLTTTSRVVDAI